MKKTKDNVIKIKNSKGVSSPNRCSRIFTKVVCEQKGNSYLDLGTGTGIVPINLALKGKVSEGTDINPYSITCAKMNMNLNKVKVNFFISNLFDNINKKYDVISFNPPVGNVSSSNLTKSLELMKYIIPKKSKFIVNSIYHITKKNRIKLIKSFLSKVDFFLNDSGKIVMVLHDSELKLIKDRNLKIRGNDLGFNIVVLEKLKS